MPISRPAPRMAPAWDRVERPLPAGLGPGGSVVEGKAPGASARFAWPPARAEVSGAAPGPRRLFGRGRRSSGRPSTRGPRARVLVHNRGPQSRRIGRPKLPVIRPGGRISRKIPAGPQPPPQLSPARPASRAAHTNVGQTAIGQRREITGQVAHRSRHGNRPHARRPPRDEVMVAVAHHHAGLRRQPRPPRKRPGPARIGLPPWPESIAGNKV